MGDDFCLDITTVAEEVETELDDADLANFGESECKKICKEAKSFCTSMVSSRQSCDKDANKLDDKVEQLDCAVVFATDKDSKKQCQKDVKQEKKDCDTADKDDAKIEKQECKDLQTTCTDSICGSGS